MYRETRKTFSLTGRDNSATVQTVRIRRLFSGVFNFEKRGILQWNHR
ncbi:hypothetical protein HMPREF7215_0082 [Pyramidobacter piscolens W5455]|uniref:Uncharacterized protein n=1 Tax=Pyramidobacter piscolens W5455 TaxID=352165 RepID=A0ABM9ZUS8_9BACT|nr:hypothetical protein HMPREF7215_0082 [Pyramidobacter piscolens W5455]